MKLRTTPAERELIDRAALAGGTDLTDLVITHDATPPGDYLPIETASTSMR